MRTQEEGRMSASIILLLLVLSIPLSYGIVIFSYNFGLGLGSTPRPSDVSGVTVISATPEGVIGEDVKAPQENRQEGKLSLTSLLAVLSMLPLAAVIALCPAVSATQNTPSPSISEKRSDFRLQRRGDSVSREHKSRANTTFISNEAAEESGCSERSGKEEPLLFALLAAHTAEALP
jgi:flagellar basal body-associated protein FliL